MAIPQKNFRISDAVVITDMDLKHLMDNLDDEIEENWEAVVDKRNNSLSYSVKCCKPKDGGPLKYLSTTIFNNCSSEMLRDFYMDNYYRKEWDKTLIDQKQLHVDETNGTEIGIPGRNACEIKMVHQEDAGLNVEMAKVIFAKGIWSYVCKMDNALRKYSE
ncbi:zinc finger, RING/FYVE/PHD-type, transmembrane fragile-X-F-associated protein, partial [Tanacetum coccineum]